MRVNIESFTCMWNSLENDVFKNHQVKHPCCLKKATWSICFGPDLNHITVYSCSEHMGYFMEMATLLTDVFNITRDQKDPCISDLNRDNRQVRIPKPKLVFPPLEETLPEWMVEKILGRIK